MMIEHIHVFSFSIILDGKTYNFQVQGPDQATAAETLKRDLSKIQLDLAQNFPTVREDKKAGDPKKGQ